MQIEIVIDSHLPTVEQELLDRLSERLDQAGVGWDIKWEKGFIVMDCECEHSEGATCDCDCHIDRKVQIIDGRD